MMKNTFSLIAVFSITILIIFPKCDIVESPYMTSNNNTINDTNSFIKKVLIEDFTGHRCQNCPEAAEEIKSLQSFYEGQIIALAIHPNTTFSIPSPIGSSSYTYDFRTEWGNEIDNIFNISMDGLPAGMVSRSGFNTEHRLGKDEWSNIVLQELSKDPYFGITLNSNYSNNIANISIEIESLSNLSDEYNVVVCLAENNIVNWQKNTNTDLEDYQHNHVLRSIINSTLGESIGSSFQIGQKWNKDYIININDLELYNNNYSINNLLAGNGNCGGWIAENMEIIVYVYNTSNYAIEQVESIPLITETILPNK
ncbi:MAG: hypothetical protein CMP51_04405 [Flavobacteriales bacterium]|nr:hypothetical protein [Flavobacteriales bacterium]|tara:strand:+ start:601 stop:1533 length:933 start_codon:yes stop_codon:yes gene_type:complete